jgi:two-component system NtrC family sensor kinase
MLTSSNVLIIGQPKRSDFGAAVVADLSSAREYLHKFSPLIVVFGQGRTNDLQEFSQFLAQASPHSRWIVNQEGIAPSLLMQWNNSGHLQDFIDGIDDPTLEDKMQTAIEDAGLQEQKLKLFELFTDQSQKLKRLSLELENRVERRYRALRKSLVTLEQTKNRLESFHRALLGIHRASSVLQMESTLNEALQEALQLLWVRIRFENQSSLVHQQAAHVLTIELPMTDEQLYAEVQFAKMEGAIFTDTESDFLVELSEALALALMRLHKLEQAEMLRAQWQATFDSIPHALCLTTREFEILKLNRAFQQACEPKTFRGLIGKNCFQAFFAKDFHPPKVMNSPFSFRNVRAGLQGVTFDDQSVNLILLRSITEEVRFERRILEASKLAELGTIGSSIAHELNNPLGGMLSFLQLILMDLKKTDTHYDEIKQMEAATLRCRDIILNLLSFARKQDLGQFALVDLLSVVARAVKLIELQSKSKGIHIEIGEFPEFKISGSSNALSQVMTNILQNSIDTLNEKMKLDPLFIGKIGIQAVTENGKLQIRVSDNGMGIPSEIQSQIFNPLFTTRDPALYNGMGLTTAFTIMSEHHGSLEILSQSGSGTTAIITLPIFRQSQSKGE